MNKENLLQKQIELATQLIVPEQGSGYQVTDGDLVFTFDIQYEGEKGFVAIDVFRWPNRWVGIFTQVYEATVPYQPGFFAFREGPLLAQAMKELCSTRNIQPNLLIVDGHGTAHPRRLGVASWLGIKMGIPSIGVAKDPLLRKAYVVGYEKGDRLPIYDREELIGHVLRSRENVKPVYVSSGHRVNQNIAVEIIFALAGEYRIIEPIRRADQVARRFSRGEWLKRWSDEIPKI